MATALTKRLATEPVSKVEVHVSCDKLMDRDITSKSDPCCLMYVMTGNQWVEVGCLLQHHITTFLFACVMEAVDSQSCRIIVVTVFTMQHYYWPAYT